MSVEVDSKATSPEIEFAKFLSASLVKDAYFRLSPQNGAFVRRDFGAVSVAYLLPLFQMTDAQVEETLNRFLENAIQNPNRQSVSYTFLLLTGAYEQRTLIPDILQTKQNEMDRSGILADIALVNWETGTYRTFMQHRIEDKKLRRVLTSSLQQWNAPEDCREEALTRTQKALKTRREILNPTVRRKGPNPIIMLIFTNILLYIGGLILESRTGTDWFLVWGIQDNGLILSGELWRLLTSMFLHADLTHLGGNMLFLYVLGRSLYPYYSHGALWGMYFVSGLIGNLAGLFFTDALSLGASGAIMGLGGVLVYRMFFGEHAKIFRHGGNFVSLVTMIIYNLLYGLFVPGIDNYGHFGGFFGGILVAALVQGWFERKHGSK